MQHRGAHESFESFYDRRCLIDFAGATDLLGEIIIIESTAISSKTVFHGKTDLLDDAFLGYEYVLDASRLKKDWHYDLSIRSIE